MFKKSIVEYGAVGDGKTLNTKYIQNAIDDCAAAGGGTVIISQGEFVTGTLFLRSNVELHFEVASKLLASLDGEDYPNFTPKNWDSYKAPRHSSRCLIYAECEDRISITGNGIIDCRGENFCEYTPTDRFWRRKTTDLPARMLFFWGCTNINIENISIVEMAGGWAVWVNNCTFVSFRGVRILCNKLYPNSDGIHINCSSDVSITDCTVNCGDDAIIVRANTNTLKEKRACERVNVSGCHLSSYSNGIRIGWTNDYEIKNCTFSDCVITDSWCGISIEFPKKSPEPFADQGEDSTVVKNLLFSNIVMDRIEKQPIFVAVYKYNDVKEIKDIRFLHMVCESCEYPKFRGREGAVIRDIELCDCKFIVDGSASEKKYITVKDVSGITMNNVTFLDR